MTFDAGSGAAAAMIDAGRPSLPEHPWERALAWCLAKGVAPGTIYRTYDLWEAMELARPKRGESHEAVNKRALAFLAGFDRLRAALLERHRVHLVTRRRSYEVAPDGEHAGIGMHVVRKGIRKALNDGARIIEHTRTELLSDRERQERADALAKIAHLRGMEEMSRGKRRV